MFQKAHARQLAPKRQNKDFANVRINHTTESELIKGYVAHSFSSFDSMGAFAIKQSNKPDSVEPTLMEAESDRHVQLTGIHWFLTQNLGNCEVEIHSTGRSLMAELGGESLWRWKDNDWIGHRGELLKHPDLLAGIADSMQQRRVCFVSGPSARMLTAVQTEARKALREWQQQNCPW